jgi:hypothetical protein
VGQNLKKRKSRDELKEGSFFDHNPSEKLSSGNSNPNFTDSNGKFELTHFDLFSQLDLLGQISVLPATTTNWAADKPLHFKAH